MYSVPANYIDAIRNSHKTFVTGLLTMTNGAEINLDDSNIAKNSMSINNQAVTSDSLEFGATAFGTLEFGLISAESQYALYNAVVTLVFHIELSKNNLFDVPLGTFYISDAKRTKNYISVTAYDGMSKLGKKYPGTVISGKPYEILAYSAKECGLQLAEDATFYANLVNGTDITSIDSDSGCVSYRDVFTAMGQMCGIFFQIDRVSGKISARQFHTEPDIEMELGDRYSSTVSDFVCKYDTLSVTSSAGTFTAGKDQENSIEMIIDDAPAWDKGLESVLESRTQLLYNYLKTIVYTPSTIMALSNPAFDCGDMITVKLQDGDSINTIITQYTWKYHNQMEIESVGTNPYLAESKSTSRTSRNTGGGTTHTKVVIYTFTNVTQFDLSSKEVTLIKFTCGCESDTTALFNATIHIRMNLDGNAIFTFYDGFRKFNSVKTYLSKGDNVVTLHNFIDCTQSAIIPLSLSVQLEYVESDMRVQQAKTLSITDWISKYQADNTYKYVDKPVDKTVPTAIIPIEGIRATLHAQGITANQKWDGIIELEEVIDGNFTVDRTHEKITVIQNAEEQFSTDVIYPDTVIHEEVIDGIVTVIRRTAISVIDNVTETISTDFNVEDN